MRIHGFRIISIYLWKLPEGTCPTILVGNVFSIYLGGKYHNPKNLWFIIKLRGYIPSCLCPLHAALAAAALSVHHAHGLTLEDRLGVYIGFAFKNLGLNLNQPIYGYIWSIAFVHEWGHRNLWPSKCGKWWSIGWKKPIWCINWFFKSFLWSRCRLITSCASGFLASQPSGDRVVWGQPIWKLLQQKSPTMKLQGPCRSLKSIQNSSHRGRDAAHWTKRSHVPGVCPA